MYGSGSDSNSAAQVFLNDFDETRLLFEIFFSLLLSCTSLILLVIPSVANKFKSNA